MDLKTKQRICSNTIKSYQRRCSLPVVNVVCKAIKEAPNAAFYEVEATHEIGQIYSGCSVTYSEWF